jgi:hypothetical protein
MNFTPWGSHQSTVFRKPGSYLDYVRTNYLYDPLICG